MLSEGQLAKLAEHGEERTAEVGDVLFRVGDRRYPLIAIVEGEAAVLDQTGAEINRHGSGGFLGETNLLSGQTVFLTAVVTELESATLRDGERIPLSFLFLFLGAAPNTDWLVGTVALDDDGFVVTGQEAGAEGILETSVPGVFAVGDVRSGSVKRCATAVGEGAMVVRFVHERFDPRP